MDKSIEDLLRLSKEARSGYEITNSGRGLAGTQCNAQIFKEFGEVIDSIIVFKVDIVDDIHVY